MATDTVPHPAETKERDELSCTSILNWECFRTDNIKTLAKNLRQATALAEIACKGWRLDEDEAGADVDGTPEALVNEALALASHGAFLLARKLGADEADEGAA